MATAENLSIPHLESRLATNDILSLSQATINFGDPIVSVDARFEVVDHQSQESSCFLAVSGHGTTKRLGILMPEVDLILDDEGHVPQIQSMQMRTMTGFYLEVFAADAHEMFYEQIPRFAPAVLRSSAGALLNFANVLAYCLDERTGAPRLRATHKRFTVHPDVPVFGLGIL